MFSVLVVLSKRFRHFYKEVVLQTTSENEVEQRLNSIALLILGKPHQDDFPGLAQIISSNAVDADKVDYVQRDSKLCNIPVGVDVARLFYRSCFLRISGKELKKIDRKATGERVYFLLNASGVDTAEEMVHSRAVLFHRVYRHKTTRLLERIWSTQIIARSLPRVGSPSGLHTHPNIKIRCKIKLDCRILCSIWPF
jgi:HD superfamily phosphohydrolase